MHEIGLMQSALDAVARVAREHNLERVGRIVLRVGLLSGAAPEALQFAFDALRAGTVAADATLEIEIVPARFQCQICKAEFELAQFEFDCAQCGGQLALRSGSTELVLATVEGEGPAEPPNLAGAEQAGVFTGPHAHS
ncbi:MAG: hydrogenase maturation nickel metallochaperone HypA [Verrucomicrobiae bacterium]|nr:hydrogenase maturation nickel metallochaperone HypA [Verrucomicrobiae bacterium]MCX7722850.1 hydrogenase maturation nickel metallochaperone HypA [Verrucomicrobiae bacterium]MDW7979504.1 hydrogenase maturation nickel metallochaperone HypA [Verrucomicrobiales bacterium]